MHTLKLLAFLVLTASAAAQPAIQPVTRVFIFAGQSNMEGADSKIGDIERFPPYVDLEQPQEDVRFCYCIGRDNKSRSDGWVPLQSVRNMVGPELSFARKVTGTIDAPIAIIKCAAGGTHLGGDWNPDQPSGFKMYPLALDLVREALAELKRDGVKYRVEGFMWHQGENDMFNADYMANYGKNLANFVSRWRRDLETPDLRFYIGELCTKTIWGMDLRPRMYAISQGQRAVTESDPLAEYVPTSHVGVEIGGGVGLHYHYGTLGQLQHGENYATAYLRNIGKLSQTKRSLRKWPYREGTKLKLFVLAGHRNMEGERCFVQNMLGRSKRLLRDDHKIAFRYSLGGGYRTSNGWEPLGVTGYYDTFGPELSFAARLRSQGVEDFAIAKFTHSGSQIIDWTPDGSVAKSRNLYGSFIEFVKSSVTSLEAKGHGVELAGVVYHLGENDMSWMPFRKGAAERLTALVQQSRIDLKQPELLWLVSQQEPTDDKAVNGYDPVPAVAAQLENDIHAIHFKAFDLPGRAKKLVLQTPGVVTLGDRLAQRWLSR